MRLKTVLATALLGAASGLHLNAASFINGNFETGDATGWTIGGGYRGGVANNALNPADVLPGGSRYNVGIANGHSSIVTPGLDPRTGNMLNQVYSGNYSWRVEDTTTGGYASAISQRVNNYTDSNIFFAWAAVLEGAHGTNDAATMKISLLDLTAGDVLISREYNAADDGSGVDPRFNVFRASNGANFFWTPWQIEQLVLPANRIGHDLQLTVLASDCEPTAHAGYLYLDGFGSVLPPPVDGVPEPATIWFLASGLIAIAWRVQRSRAKQAVKALNR